MKRLLILFLLIVLGAPIAVHADKPPVVTTSSNSSSLALAEHLRNTGVVKYSAYWCPHCYEQNQLFGKKAAAKLLDVECAIDGENSRAELCRKKGITGFPSWEINGTIESGIKTLEELAELSDFQGLKEFK